MSLIKPSPRQRFLSYLLLISFVLQSCALNASITPTKEIPLQLAAERVSNKLKNTSETLSVREGWYNARLLTFGTHVYTADYHTKTYTLRQSASDPVVLRLYQQAPWIDSLLSSSQGLVIHTERARSFGASVDTSIQTKTKRKDEITLTHVQYDKARIQQVGKDFEADDSYDGGHLIDHKFSAEDSHTANNNYVPQHHFYNRWIKEGIVEDASVSGYLEIPIYTPNPPTIKVKGKARYDQIPAGMLLVTFRGEKIGDVYYCPNDRYDYRACQANLGMPGAKSMGKYFKLKPAFHKLLAPAIIYYDVRTKDTNIILQQKKEAEGVDAMDQLVKGILDIDLSAEESLIANLAFDTFNERAIDVANLLDVPPPQLSGMTSGQANPDAFQQAFDALGQFLVKYSMENVSKSEVLMTCSRIRLADIVTRLIGWSALSEEELESVIDGKAYRTNLEELWNMRAHMSLQDIICFAKLYQQLAANPKHALYSDGYKPFEGMDFVTSVERFSHILLDLYNKQIREETPDASQVQSLVHLFEAAYASLSSVGAYPEVELEKYLGYLKFAKGQIKERWGGLLCSSLDKPGLPLPTES
jgi:hypothetical protein